MPMAIQDDWTRFLDERDRGKQIPIMETSG